MSGDLFTQPETSDHRMLAAGYLRVSTETQLDGYGLEIQRDAVTELADTEGLDLVAVFVDEGICGAEGLDARVDLAAALDWLAEHPGATLIIPRLDRLARDLMIQEQVLADAWRTGGIVLSCSATERVYCQPDTPDDPARTLIRQVLGAVAAYERAMIRKRMTAGRRRLLDQQGWAGGPEPYGWSDAGERAILSHVQARRDLGIAWRIIAAELNANGHRKRSGRAWTPQELHRAHARAAARTHVDAESIPLTPAGLWS